MLTTYATVDDLTTWMGQAAPPEAARLLARASRLIDAHVVARYSRRDDGSFVDPNIEQGLRDATTAQVEWWLKTGDAEEASARFSSGDRSVTRGISVQSSGVRLAPQAADALLAAGLLSGAVGAY